VRETGPVVGGLAVIALSGYAVLAMAGHELAPAQYTGVASLYLLVSVLGPGVFVAVEQQTTRDVAARVAGGQGWAPVLRTSTLVSTRLAAVVTAAVAIASPVLVTRVFGGSWLLLVGLLLAVWGAAAGYPLRGVFAGHRRFGWYGACMGVEGVARTTACTVLAVVGVTTAGWYGLVFGAGLVLAALVTGFGPRAGGDGPPADPRRMTNQVGLLAGGSALTLVVANLGPVVLASRLGPAGAALAAAFVSLFVLARIPILLVTPAQAVLLPRLAAAVQRGETDRVRRSIRRTLLALAAAAVPVLAVWVPLGPWLAEVFFAAPMRLGRLSTGLLGLGTVGIIAAQVVSPALVALGRHRSVTSAWGVGTVVFLVLLATPGPPLFWTVAAQTVAPAVVLAVMLRALHRPVAAELTVANRR
jgi:O-antigen/teichoic acid export membrane protein